MNPACPDCGEPISDDARVCPHCRPNLGGTSRRKSNSWSLTGAVIAIAAAAVIGALLIVGVLAAFLLPAMSYSREAPRRSMSKANLKQIAIALHNHHDEKGSLPPAAHDQRKGTAEHGWQTALLRYIEEEPIYDSIDFDQPWDAPANSAPFRHSIDFFLIPGVETKTDAAGYALSHYAGNVQVLKPEGGLKFNEIRDGLTYTILVGEAVDSPRAWGDPKNLRDPAAGLKAGPATFGGPWTKGGTHFVAGDGAVHMLDDSFDLAGLRLLATPNGGERHPP